MAESSDLNQLFGNNFLGSFLQQIVTVSQSSNELPEKEELGFYRRIPSCSQNIKNINATIGECMKLLADFALPDNNVDPQKTISYKSIIDPIEVYLENVDMTVDKIKQHGKQDKALLLKEKIDNTSSLRSSDKPQVNFQDKVDNSPDFPFIPKITKKYNGKSPLDESILLAQANKQEFFKDIKDPGQYEFNHPYQEELDSLEYNPSQLDLQVTTQPPVAFTEANFLLVESPESFEVFLKEITDGTHSEIAIDLEHHNIRSYQGFTCLMQLSTRTKDYIIDVIKLRHLMHELNIIFTDPKVVKVLHGANMDIEWLQKDFGLYVVNMFDTGQAARYVKFPSAALAYLLKEFCKVNANKEYQRADWRQRPLSKDMIKYAREDTHYLLYIYDEIRKTAIKFSQDNSLDPVESLKSILNKSRMICLKTYQKPQLKSENYYSIMTRNKAILSRRKYKILKTIYRWRDDVARAEDESPFYIIASNIMFDMVDQYPFTKDQLKVKFKQFNLIHDQYIESLLSDLKAVEKNTEKEQKDVEAHIQRAGQIKSNDSQRGFITSVIFDEMAPEHTFNYINTNPSFSLNKVKDESDHDYHKIFAAKKPEKEKPEIKKIINSFSYMTLTDFTLSFDPNYKNQIVQLQKEYVGRMKEKTAKAAANKVIVDQAKLDGDNGLLMFSEDKESGPKQKKAEPLRLPLEETKKQDTLPASLKEQYDVSKNKRKRNKNKKNKIGQDFNDKVKKLKQDVDESTKANRVENKYEALMNSSGDEEPGDIDSMKVLSSKNKNTFQKFWDKFSKKQADDPFANLQAQEQASQKRPVQRNEKTVAYQKNKYSRKGIHK